MTIFYKSMLSAAAQISSIEDDPALNTVLLEPAGEIVSINKWAIFIASPVLPAIIKSLPLKNESLSSATVLSCAQTSELVKMVPLDKQFRGLLEHISITPMDNRGNTLKASFNNGKATQDVVIRSALGNKTLLSWKERFKTLNLGKVIAQKQSQSQSFVYNRLRLKTIVSALEIACKYSGEFDFISQRYFENGCIWSVFNGQTGQQVLITWVLPKTEVKETDWEQSLFFKKKKVILTRSMKEKKL